MTNKMNASICHVNRNSFNFQFFSEMRGKHYFVGLHHPLISYIFWIVRLPFPSASSNPTQLDPTVQLEFYADAIDYNTFFPREFFAFTRQIGCQ